MGHMFEVMTPDNTARVTMHTLMNSYTFAYAILCNIAYTITVMDVVALLGIVVWCIYIALGIGYIIMDTTAPYRNIMRNIRKRNQYINARREDRRR